MRGSSLVFFLDKLGCGFRLRVGWVTGFFMRVVGCNFNLQLSLGEHLGSFPGLGIPRVVQKLLKVDHKQWCCQDFQLTGLKYCFCTQNLKNPMEH